MGKQLVVNADDLGYTPGITRGIFRAHLEGIVTSSTVMINMPDAEESVHAALADAPRLGLGLHLTLTAGPPVSAPSQIPDLVDESGRFHHQSELIKILSSIDPHQIEQEYRAQLDRFMEVVGRPPDHLDSHHHSACFSLASALIMMQIAQELNIPVRRPVSIDPQKSAQTMRHIGVAKDEAEATELFTALEGLLDRYHVVSTDWFVTSFFGKSATLGDLLNILTTLRDGTTEIMCHPGEVDQLLRETSSYLEPREIEIQALTHPSVNEVLDAEGIELINFGALVQ